MTTKASFREAFTPKIITCLRKYSWSSIKKDCFAGFSVAIVALPLSMAFAIASGVTPQIGLYTAIIAGFFTSLFGGTRYLIGGPTGAFIVIVVSISSQYGFENLILVTFLSGILLVFLGFLRFGAVIKYIPYPVIIGFTAGIAVIISSSQVKDFLGLDIAKLPGDFIEKIATIYHNIGSINFGSVAIGLLTIFIIAFVRKVKENWPALIIAIIASSFVAYYFELKIDTIGSYFGGIPKTFPSLRFPSLEWSNIKTLIPSIFTVSSLIILESLLAAVVADNITKTTHRPNCELIGQGMANCMSSLFGGLPATGAIARTVTNIKSGAVSPISGMIHSLVLLLFILFLAPLTNLIPLASLSGILMIVSWNMCEKERFFEILKNKNSDALVLVLTFLLTIFVDLTVAVQIGIILASLLFIKSISAAFKIDCKEEPGVSKKVKVQTIQINGPLFFGSSWRLKKELPIKAKTKVLVLNLQNVPFIDSSGVSTLDYIIKELEQKGIKVILINVNERCKDLLQKNNFLENPNLTLLKNSSKLEEEINLILS